MPLVSVIVPTYNHQDHLLETVNSVFAQTFTDYELIIVNDGSSDGTAELLRPLADLGRIRYIEQANLGVSIARNRGLAEARGEFIAFLDDDDLWPLDKLAWQLEVLQTTDFVLVGGKAVQIKAGHPDVTLPGTMVGVITRENLLDGPQFYSLGQMLIRGSVLKAVSGFDGSLRGAEDYDLYLKLARHGAFCVKDKVSLYYRSHDGNSSRARDKMLSNCLGFARQNFPSSRTSEARRVYRWVYGYAGRERVGAVKTALRARDIRAAVGHLRALLLFAGPAMNNPGLAKEIAVDLLPASLTKVNSPR